MTQQCPVNSHTEWDPLEEVIVGSVEGAVMGAWDNINRVTVPPGEWDEIVKRAGGPMSYYPKEFTDLARKELENFVRVLESEGVIVKRIDDLDYARKFGTPDWEVPGGFCAANPRDPFLIVGNEIIETPMADRSRYFEAWAYRRLFKEYFRQGAKWTSAPKPQLTEELYDPNYRLPEEGEEIKFILTEFEPVFDAADFVRCGKDIFCQKSHVTNQFGIDWLQRHLGDEYRVHLLESTNHEAIHIDTTFLPLAPGRVLVNPAYVNIHNLPDALKHWELLIAPPPPPPTDPLTGMSEWSGLNILMLDSERVIVEEKQEAMIKCFKEWGFKPIPVPFEHYLPFLGSFHCATLDIRRRGELKSYC